MTMRPPVAMWVFLLAIAAAPSVLAKGQDVGPAAPEAAPEGQPHPAQAREAPSAAAEQANLEGLAATDLDEKIHWYTKAIELAPTFTATGLKKVMIKSCPGVQ